jgi:hypothetical protein
MTTNPIDDDGADWDKFSPEKLHALAGQSENFAVARRLISTIATSAEHPDGGESMHGMLVEIANGDPVGVALAASAEYVRLAAEVYGEHVGTVLRIRAERQLDLAEKNKREFGD